MMIVGITGGYGTGKTAALRFFKEMGARTFSADRVVHHLMRPGKILWKNIVKNFGTSILMSGNIIDRKKLGEIVFSKRDELKKLNSITHPYIKIEIKKNIDKYKRRSGVLVLEIPLLFEAGIKNWFDKIIIIGCNTEMRMSRISKKRNIKKEDILKRMKSQWTLSKKRRFSDFYIDNNYSLENTKKQVVEIYRELKKETITK